MTSGAPIMSSQKIGPNSLASRARFCTGAVESSDSMLPTTGLVGGCGIGLSRLVDAIAIVPCLLATVPSLRGAAARKRIHFRYAQTLDCFVASAYARSSYGGQVAPRNEDSGPWFTQTAFYAIRSAWR